MISKFANISKNIRCLHSEGEAILIAKSILEEKDMSPVVECGCFKGGMTCKLSIACKIAGKKLHVYDTFQGLPRNEDSICYPTQKHRDGIKGIKKWRTGSMSGGLNEVAENVKNYGEISCCKFFPGLIEETLPLRKEGTSLVFIDVDLKESAKCCIKHLWPMLRGKYMFSHEMWFKDYVESITDRTWWLENLGQEPPELTGSETGASTDACDLGYFKKIRTTS